MVLLVLFAVAALAGSAAANFSPFCGRWVSNCVPDYTTSVYINTSLTTMAYTYPIGQYPTVDYEGTYGSVAFTQQIYNTSACGTGDLQAIIYRFGDWVDKGPAKLSRQIALSPTSMKIRPYTDYALTHLQTVCPCGNASAWQIGTMRTLTRCADNTCSLTWINYTNIGLAQYGLARVDTPTQTMNVSSFTSDSSFPITPTIYTYHRDENCTAYDPQMDLCGDYNTKLDCRASTQAEFDFNVVVSFNLVGNAVGSFQLGYDYYTQDDTSCSQEFVGSFHTQGTYALHGPSNCGGTCSAAQKIEVFATSATFRPNRQQFVDLLNNICPCNGTWALNQARTISVCPVSTCSSLSAEEFTHGIPVGTIKEAYGNVIAFSTNFLSVTRFSEINDYSTSFDVGDHALVSMGTSEGCAAGITEYTLSCGQYISNCQGSADGVFNYEENTTFFGPTLTGEFRRVYRKFAFNDRFCSNAPLAEYVLTGTFNLASPSTCSDCTAGTYTQFEVSITRAQFTLNDQDSLDSFKASCPCSKATTWRLGQPNIITTCDIKYGCGIETFPGINGLNVGAVEPAYGTLTRFGPVVAVTELSTDMATGFSQNYSSKVPLLNFNQQFTDCPMKSSNSVCGVYHDTCRGGSADVDNDNVVRSLTLYGDSFGEFTLSQIMYQPFDTDCTPDNVNGYLTVYGTFAIHGPSDCGGSCAGVGAQKLEMSVSYVSATFYNQDYLNSMITSCPCGDQWVLEQPRVFGDCPPGSCTIDIRGLLIGTGVPQYGSILRFGDMATRTMMNPSSVAGYSLGFSSQDQAVMFDPTTISDTCPAPITDRFCGVYESPCSGYGGFNDSNTIESVTFDGNLSGAFTRSFKVYSAAQEARCNTLVVASWQMSGTYTVNGTSDCGGFCNGTAMSITITSAVITLTSSSEVEKFNSLCPCGGDWVVGRPHYLDTTCHRCQLSEQAGSHGLNIGTGETSYGTIMLTSNRLAMTTFNKNPTFGWKTAFAPTTDHVFISNPTTAANSLYCAGYVAPSGGSSSSSDDSGLSAGDGLLIAFFCIVGVYLIGGMALNYRSGATGQDLLPHLSFWKGIPGLVGDGFRFAFIDCFGVRGSSVSGSSSYVPVQSSRGGYGSV